LEEGVITNESGKVRHDNIPLPIAERVMKGARRARRGEPNIGGKTFNWEVVHLHGLSAHRTSHLRHLKIERFKHADQDRSDQ